MSLKKLEVELDIRGRSPTTRKYYLIQTRLYIEFVVKSGYSFGVDSLKGYIQYLLRTNKKKSSINTIIMVIKFYLREVLEVCTEDELKKVKALKLEKKLVEVLTKEEIMQILKFIKSKKHRLIYMLMFGSGMRIDEACKFEKDWLITLTLTGGKGSKDRPIVLSNLFKKEVNAYLQEKYKEWKRGENSEWVDSPYLFPSNRKQGYIDPRTFQRYLHQYVKEAGLDRRVTPHMLRKSSATFLLNSGNDVKIVQEYLGHSDIRTTMGYVKVDPERVRGLRSPLDS